MHIHICISIHAHTLQGHNRPHAATKTNSITMHTHAIHINTHMYNTHTHPASSYTHCTHITSMQPTIITSHKNRALYRALMPCTSHHNHNPALLPSKLTCNTITNKNSRHTIIKPLSELNT